MHERYYFKATVVLCPGVRPGVCLGNWVETRAVSSQLSVPAKFDATSTMRSDYSPAVSFLLLCSFVILQMLLTPPQICLFTAMVLDAHECLSAHAICICMSLAASGTCHMLLTVSRYML